MALFVYITDQCKKDSIQHNRWDDVQKFKDRILADQRTELFDRYPAPYLKKRFARQQRLLAAERYIGEHAIVCFYRLLIRGDKEYTDFKSAPVEYGDRFFLTLVSDEELRNWVEAQVIEDCVKEKSTPTNAEYSYLWNTLSKENYEYNEVMVYESEDWVLSVQSNKVRDRLILLAPQILEKAECEELNCNTISTGDGKLEIVYRKFHNIKKLFLAGVYLAEDEKNGIKILERYDEVLKCPQDDIKTETIIRNSVRSYPAFILLEEDIWINIQKDNESNLALSPEESELLNSVQNTSNDSNEQVGLPLFINGRAGSGKSTILQYLFADYVHHSLSEESKGCASPLYLTYSNELVKRSKEVVCKLLKTGHKFSFASSSENSIEEVISDSFREFHEFMLSLLDVNERIFFPEEKFVDYTVFKNEWYKKFSNDPKALRDYGPDLSWHVVRTYIKGLSQDDYMELEEYEELPKDEKSVSNETFEKVYARVWLGWYFQNCQPDDPERKYWDNQDLVRYLLLNGRITPLFPVIFCDEAQDFTRIELDAILRLSVFSDRKLTAQDLSRVPFVFAGDPLQTLNPTGFRWEAIKSIFIQKFIFSLDPSRQSRRTELNYRELIYNYRSTKNIVYLNNSIQMLRAALFDYKGLLPQTTWQFEKSSPFPVYFKTENPDVRAKLKGQSDLMIIVPCGQGGEVDFVKNDTFLQGVVEVDEKGVPQNVLSPMRAKGLEYKRVVLYGFGEYMPEKLIDIGYNQVLSMDKRLTNEYFINQLYVAASRPQKRLFVVDSSKGVANLWKFATDLKFQEEIFSQIKNGEEIWKNSLGFLQEGTEDSWTKDRESLLAVAQRQEMKGLDENDAYSFRQASQTYAQEGDSIKSFFCRAKAYELEGQFKSAGDLFSKANSYDLAIDAYWKGQFFEEIYKLSELKDVPKTPKVKISIYLSRKGTLDEITLILSDVLEKTTDSAFGANLIKDNSWSIGLNKTLELILKNAKNIQNDKANLQKIALLLDAISEKISNINSQNLGDLFHISGNSKRALEIWEKAEVVSSAFYREAKLKLLLEKTKNGEPGKLESSDIRILGEHYLKEKNYAESASWYAEILDSDKIAEILNEASSLSRIDIESIKKIGRFLIKTLIDKKNWSTACEFVKSSTHKNIKGHFVKTIKQNIDLKNEFEFELIKLLATSPFLPIATTSEQKIVSDYLELKFLKNNEGEPIIHPLLVGAALERAGRIVDCLKYYEQKRNAANLDESEKRVVLERWIKSKIRRAENLEQLGKSSISKAQMEEAIASAKNWGVDFNKITDYPLVSKYIKNAKIENSVEPQVQSIQSKPISEKEQIIPKTNQQQSSLLPNELEVVTISNKSEMAIQGTDLNTEIEVVKIPDGIEMADRSIDMRNVIGLVKIPEANIKLPDTSSLSIGKFNITIYRLNKRINIEQKATGEQGSIHFAETFEFKSAEVESHKKDDQIDIPSWQMVVTQQNGLVQLRIKVEGLILLFER